MKINQYFNKINLDLQKAYDIAQKARSKGYDPEDHVEMPIAKNMAERVEGLISTVAPQIVGAGIAKRINELEKKYGVLDWRIAFTIAEEIAKGNFCRFKDKLEAIEIGIRVGFAYLTLGTVASPLEGFTHIKLRKNKQGEDYFAVFYSGPVRSAGGTGAAVSVLIADYVRKKLGYGVYDPSEEEIKRMVTELNDYHERITNLQYSPSDEEVDFLVRNLPVQIDGEPSEKLEVSTCKDLQRIETNRIRNGPCLVIGECLAQKAPKLWKQLSRWGDDFDLGHWAFLKEFIRIQKEIKSKGKSKEEKTKINPDYTYLKDLPAGRPVLADPLTVGGFRLRYGRSRTGGFSSSGIHPATMAVLKNYIAIGTQLKTERPGKSTALTSCDSIEGPTVLLNNGEVLKIESTKQAKQLNDSIKEIIFLGDILTNYGDFFNRAHPLVPAGYCEEWWIQDLEKATVNLFGALDIDKLSELVEIPKSSLEILLKEPITTKLTASAAISLSKKLNIPLHPAYAYYWKTISTDQLNLLAKWVEKAKVNIEDNEPKKVIFPLEQEPKRVLEILGVQHTIANNEFVVIEKEDAFAFCSSLGILKKKEIKNEQIIEQNKEKNALEIINMLSEVKIMDKAGTFIGARMGRPEKAKVRELIGSPQVLFPVGDEGGRLRSFQSALESGKIRAEFPIYYCEKCNKETVLSVCLQCDTKTKKMYYCKICGNIPKETCSKHGPAEQYKKQTIDIKQYFDLALKKLKTKTYPDLIKGVRGTSNKQHIAEHLIKGILRSKHGVYVNKDGTTRYDMTQLGITHFKPKEISTSIDKLKQLGYEQDIYGRELQDKDQILEILPQDVILPACQESPDEGANKILFRVANFIDDMLNNLYNLDQFYNLKSEEDLVGHLILGLAPHTSAAIVGRIIGFSRTQGYFAHPLFHAAHRRDLDGDESCVILLMDALLNFSKQFLPAHRGSAQDAPLVLTSTLIPSEVDDMVFDIDVCWRYPLEFYEACAQYKNPWEVKIEQLGSRLATEREYYDMGFTHPTSSINKGVKCSAYKLIPSMEEKLKGQMELAEKIRAVDQNNVARLVIEKHFLKDIRGNLRKFSMQQVRCVQCNEKYRRTPLIGKCTKCGGRIIFTISEGSIIKYLEPSISIANKYNVPVYLKQNLELTKRRIEGVFGKDKEKQEGLGRWFG